MISIKEKKISVEVILPRPSLFFRGLHFCRSMIYSTMDGFCHLYLPVILLMRSGDIETNPGPNTLESTISEMELLKLAQDIPPSYYMAVGISLGISYAQLQGILIQRFHNYSDAFLAVFMTWNAMHQPPHTNKREVLADRLRVVHLGDLSDQLCNGRLISNSIGGPLAPSVSRTQPPSAESQTEPLSPELIKQCANDFKFKYRSTLCKIRADPLNPASLVQFEDMYTNLVLQEEFGRGKRMLDYNDLLDLRVNGEFPKRLMVQGEAGAGKTTLCAKIAWDWIQERFFKKYVWLLIVHLRDAQQYTLGQIAKSYLAKNNPATASQLAEYIQSNPDKVFIAFDGLDEFRGKVTKEGKDGSKSEYCQSQSNDQPSQPRVNSSEACGNPFSGADIGLADILCSDQLASCPVVVTSRPWRAVEVRSDHDLMELYTFIHVEGFSRENLSVYIHKYFAEDEARANQLIQFVDENDVISENMAHYPIYVAMLCLMWNELTEQKLKEIKALQTFSQIFKEMICFLKEHYAQKKMRKVGCTSFLEYLKEIDMHLKPLAELALTGLMNNTLTFTEGHFQKFPECLETACRVGILSQEDRITSSIDIHERNSHVQLPVFFPHKLFQEYMAGVYLASLYESDCNEFNRLIGQVLLPGMREFRYLLYFTVSQNKAVATHIMTCIGQSQRTIPTIYVYKNTEARNYLLEMMDNKYDIDRDLLVDVALESQDPDVAGLVKDRVAALNKRLRICNWMTAHTVGGYAFTRSPVAELHVERDCGPTMSLDVAEMICSIPSLKRAFLSGASVHSDFFAVLAGKGKGSKVQTLQLDGVKCPTPASSSHLAEALCSMPNLSRLKLLGRDLSEEFFSTLKAKASSIQVHTLLLYDVKCPTTTSSNHLGRALCSMPNLTDLTLHGMDLNEEFCSALKARASSVKIQALNLDNYGRCPTPASSHHLAKALCSMPHLTDLILCRMVLCEEFCSTLKAKASSLQVQTLNLQHVQCLTPASSHHLAEALCSLPNLTDLTLGGIDLSEEFCSELKAKASSIQGCFPQVRKGNFQFNGVSQEDMDSFLCSLTAFQSWNMYSQAIGT